MAKSKRGRKPTNHFVRWTPSEDSRLVTLFKEGKTARQVARELKRSRQSVSFRKVHLKENFVSQEAQVWNDMSIVTPDGEIFVQETNRNHELIDSLGSLVEKYGISCTVHLDGVEILLNKQ